MNPHKFGYNILILVFINTKSNMQLLFRNEPVINLYLHSLYP